MKFVFKHAYLFSILLACLLLCCQSEEKPVNFNCGLVYFCEVGEVFEKPASIACTGEDCAQRCRELAEPQGLCPQGCFSPDFESDSRAVCKVSDFSGQGGGSSEIIAPKICSDVYFCNEKVIYQGADGVFCGPTGCDEQDCLDTATMIGTCREQCVTEEVATSSDALCSSFFDARED